ncbi:heme NO-binding domain-containing protein [Lutimaribacter marinistellae]|uniref:Heme NO-binding domain-containing protein n=1 Tax=Lutimaribacter marinistellae TaxID=1820329 RepID=A0ABV7TLE9_9RHOB
MHGLVNRALQSFVCGNYGHDRWIRITEAAQLGFVEFEAMLLYDDATSLRLLDAICSELARPQEEVLEDLGTYLVSNPSTEALRRLLRFGGVNYLEFLHSLDDLSDRARLAVSDLVLPALELHEHAHGRFTLNCHPGLPGYSYVMMGILRTMADDYGALVMLEHEGHAGEGELISITLVESAFSEGRSFELGVRTG